MGEKKSKALAQDLIDELLNDGTEVSREVTKPKKSTKKKRDEEASLPSVTSAPIEINDFLDLQKTEVSDAGQVTEAVPIETEVEADVPAVPALGNDNDSTERINASHLNHTTATGSADPEDRVRASVGRFGAFRSGGQASTTEAALAQSESLRIAQARLLDLEGEIERLRLQNEELAAAGETLRRRTDELLAENQRRESDYQHAISTFEQEKEILTNSKEALQRDLELQRRKVEELELRISTNIQKIRVRERELENRLELVKMESAALIRSKDEMILELKRNTDQLNLELNNYRAKNQELNRLTNDKQEMLRRTVKALRLALSMLEGEEEVPKTPQRKAK